MDKQYEQSAKIVFYGMISIAILILIGGRRPKSKNKEKTVVKIGANFNKIRYFNISLIAVMCFVIPAILGYMQSGFPDIPPVSYLGIPLGFMIHYHVRMRSLKTLKRFIETLN
mgnify:CR=1 FL=1